MASPQHRPLAADDGSNSQEEKSNDNASSASDAEHECFLYDTDVPPTRIESIFGEPYHVKDKYASHQITFRFVITIFSVYFVEGCIDWMFIAMRYYGTSVWDIGPAEMQRFRSVVSIPWTIKIIYGLTIDSVQLFGYKRKSWMLLFGLIGPLSMLCIITWSTHYYVQLVFMTVVSLSIAFCDVIADALNVERTEFKSHCVATRLQCLAWGSRYVASIAGILVSTRIELSGKPRDMLVVYWLYFFMWIPIIICSVLLPEDRVKTNACRFWCRRSAPPTPINVGLVPAVENDPVDSVHNAQTQAHAQEAHVVNPSYSVPQILYLVFETLCRKSVFYPILFAFLFCVTPTSDEAMDYFLMYELQFSSIWIGYLKVAGGVAFLVSIGIIAYLARQTNRNFSLRKTFVFWTLLAAVLPFMTLIIVFGWNEAMHIPATYFMVSDKVVVSVAVDMLVMSLSVLYARICPPGIEGVFMTVLTSTANIGAVIGGQISSKITEALKITCDEDPNDADKVVCDFTNLWILIVIVNLSTFLPLLLIKKVPNERQLQNIGEELKDATSFNLKGKNRTQLIWMYGACMDFIFPCVQKKLCCCMCSSRQSIFHQHEIELNEMVNNAQLQKSERNGAHHELPSDDYAAIEMR